MKNVKIKDFVEQLAIEIPSEEKFLELSKKTQLIPELIHLHSINFERGMLLYGLIAKLKPKTVLEIGTAGGYSTLSMAWALTDYNINGKIFTIDPKPFEVDSEKSYSKQHWESFARNEWIEKIEVIT